MIIKNKDAKILLERGSIHDEAWNYYFYTAEVLANWAATCTKVEKQWLGKTILWDGNIGEIVMVGFRGPGLVPNLLIEWKPPHSYLDLETNRYTVCAADEQLRRHIIEPGKEEP